MKLKKPIKNLWVTVNGLRYRGNGLPTPTIIECIITNDEVGKTLSIKTNDGLYTIPFEQIEKFLK